MNKIGVFCSAADSIDAKYFEAAEQLGKWMGLACKTLIYGGTNCGLMGAIARAAKANGARLYGMVPLVLEERGIVNADLDVTFPCHDLSDRKDLMLQESDVLVALPGGVGTLDEAFMVMGSSSIGFHQKKVIFYNVDGFWQHILDFLDGLSVKGFARHPMNHYYLVANTHDELINLLSK